MFNMIFKFAHYLCNWLEFWIFGDYENQAYLNINTRLMFNIILKNSVLVSFRISLIFIIFATISSIIQ